MQKKFGMAIKKLREETGLSQEKFALSIGMNLLRICGSRKKKNFSSEYLQDRGGIWFVSFGALCRCGKL